jgi:integrase
MAKTNLTPLSVQNAKPRRLHGKPILTEISDAQAKGLRLLVHPTGSKAWIVRFRVNGRSRKLTLGPVAALRKGDPNPEGALTLAIARIKAAEVQARVEHGHDPAAEKLAYAQQQQQQQDASAMTFEAVASAYYARMAKEKPNVRSGDRQLADLERWVFPTLGKRPITSIKRSDVVRLLDTISTERGPTAADAALALIGKVMTDHSRRDDNYQSVIVRGMRKTSTKERARDRVLIGPSGDHEFDELRAIWKAASEDGVFGAFVKFLLLTAARRNEAALMTWGEIGNGNGMVWTLPAARNKAKVELIRPLSKAAQQVLATLPRGEPDELVFQGDGRRVIANLDPMKKAFDKQCGIEEGWTLHDLRRTARTLLSRARINSDHAERCLGHVIRGVRGVYDKHEFFDEKKHAFEALATLIGTITAPQDSRVIPMHR